MSDIISSMYGDGASNNNEKHSIKKGNILSMPELTNLCRKMEKEIIELKNIINVLYNTRNKHEKEIDSLKRKISSLEKK